MQREKEKFMLFVFFPKTFTFQDKINWWNEHYNLACIYIWDNKYI